MKFLDDLSDHERAVLAAWGPVEHRLRASGHKAVARIRGLRGDRRLVIWAQTNTTSRVTSGMECVSWDVSTGRLSTRFGRVQEVHDLATFEAVALVECKRRRPKGPPKKLEAGPGKTAGFAGRLLRKPILELPPT